MSFYDGVLEEILKKYTASSEYHIFKNARDQYNNLTGKLDEEFPNFEARMNMFQDWFVFNYRTPSGRRIVDLYMDEHELEKDIELALHQVKFSVFHFQKYSFTKKIVLYDLISGKKMGLSKKHPSLGIMKDDLFVGRLLSVGKEHFLTPGLTILPNTIISKIKKQAKKVKSMHDPYKEEEFLLNLERLNAKSFQYKHIDPQQLFDFSKEGFFSKDKLH